jgi:ABC-type transport system involved in cytochrome c biogenesis permease subunit
MATDLQEAPTRLQRAIPSGQASSTALFRAAIAPFASLKLTVALFALSIFIVFAGTLAQVHMDIWEVVHEYFRLPTHFEAYTSSPWGWIDALLARIQLKIFFPQSFFPDFPDYAWLDRYFYFPKGWLIGALMLLNLAAAHAVRFRVQVAGTRLVGGVLLLAVGCLVTYAVIHSGAIGDESGVQDSAFFGWTTVWRLIKAALAGLWCVLALGTAMMDEGKRRLRAILAVISGLSAAGLVAVFVFGDTFVPDEPSVRILWQLLKGAGAGLVLLAGCMLVFRQRAGIVLIHAGIGLMMFSELLVGTLSVESQFTAQDGQIKNYTEDRRTCELAILDLSGTQMDTTVIPRSLIEEGNIVRRDDLPFDVEVVKFIPNTAWRFRPIGPREENLATAGFGATAAPVVERRSTGVDADAKFEMPAAYVTLSHKESGQSLGTHLLSTVKMSHWDDSQNEPETVSVDGKKYVVALRPKRIYKPFWIEVVDARQDNYTGTRMARNFSTDVRLFDSENKLILEKHIWMNNPLRYAGETYYQSGFNDKAGFDLTTLQVVSNKGWMIPYVSCMIVAVGLLYHFGQTLLKFARRQHRTSRPGRVGATDEIAAGETSLAQPVVRDGCAESRFARWLAPGILLAAVLMTAYVAVTRMKPYEGMDLVSFGKLPVMDQGRCKPFDTLARSALRIVAKQETFKDAEGRRHPAIRWLLDLISGSAEAGEHRVFKIENFDLQEMLGVQPRRGYLYSFNEISGNVEKLTKIVEDAEQLERQEPAKLTLFQRKAVDFARRYRAFLDIQEAFETVKLPTLPAAEGLKTADTRAQSDAVKNELIARLSRQQALRENGKPPLAIAAQAPDGAFVWETFTAAQLHDFVHKTMPPGIASQFSKRRADDPWLGDIFAAYRDKDAANFNNTVETYRKHQVEHPPPEFVHARIEYESFFNRVEPFYLASWLYLAVFVLSALAWLGWSRPLHRAAFYLAAFTLLLHTWALASRIYISGRPPVTTLYSSAVFISWGCVFLALVLELVFRLGIGNALAGACGAGALLVAHFLSYDSGDTFQVLIAVLDTQFWLATHVVCVTLGYATTFLAGWIGVLFVVLGVGTPMLDSSRKQPLARMIYGTVCFGLFFSFVGTVLGGLWADDSWGRFWGWDPKENGALMIVLWNALILHARWDGLVKDRGMAVLSIGGNVVTAWSWFGTNELRVGLHSYGFTEGVVEALFVFWSTQVALMIVGMLPRRWWWSERANGSRHFAAV